jgi:hypothetical protein
MSEHETIAEMHVGCRVTAAGKIDGRTKEAALLRRVRAELTAHLGGSPTIEQRALIERIAILRLRLHRLDLDLAAGRPVDDLFHLACCNSLSRLLRRLGPPAPPPQPTLAEHLARRAAERAA